MKISKNEIERIFRTSNSSDELFDTFRSSISNKIEDEELYKTLLWNKALSPDEIAMYAKKICKEFPRFKYNIYFGVGQIFESLSVYGIYHETALSYFLEAAKARPENHEPYIAISKMYNRDLNVPNFEKVVKVLAAGLEGVHLKSKICFALMRLYKKKGNIEKERYYQSLGEKYQRELH